MTSEGTAAGASFRLRVLITGGGTGGHVYPGLAVAQALRRMAPEAEVRFAGTSRGLEAVLVPRAGFPFHRVPASGYRGLGTVARVLFVLNFVAGVLCSLMLLLRRRPAVVLGTGGYVSAPVMAAARMLGVPCALQEQNAVPGSANRLVGRWTRRVYLGFASAAARFPRGRTVVTGNPVRAAFCDGMLDEAATPLFATAADLRKVLVFGGSGGAHTLNRAVSDAAVTWLARPDLALLVQTGRREHEAVAQAYPTTDSADRFRVVPYIDDMFAALSAAELVVCRAGAMTLAELHCLGKPAVLVPFPHATDGHQLRNARDCEAAGAAVVLEDGDCDAAALVRVVDDLLADRTRLLVMARCAASLARPQAANDIAGDLLHLVGHPAGCALVGAEREEA